MPDDNVNLPGGVPPKPAEAKVQPKKETVRITLPPKPTASPTIKLPTLPGGGPGSVTTAPPAPAVPSHVGAPSAAAAPSSAPPRPPASPGTKLAGAPSAKPTASAPTAQKPGAPPPPAQKPVGPKPASTVGVFDKVLTIFALVASLTAVGTMLFLMNLLDKTQVLLDEIPK